MTRLEVIKIARNNALEIEEYFGRLLEKDIEMCNFENEWESSYWKFYIKSVSNLNFFERLYEKERNKKCREKDSKSEKTDK